MSHAEVLAGLDAQYEASVGRIHSKILAYQRVQARKGSSPQRSPTIARAGADVLRRAEASSEGAAAAARPTLSSRRADATGVTPARTASAASARLRQQQQPQQATSSSSSRGGESRESVEGLASPDRCAQMLAQLPRVESARFPNDWEGVGKEWSPRNLPNGGRPSGPGIWWPPAAPPQQRTKEKRRKPSLFDTKNIKPIELTRKNPLAALTVAKDNLWSVIPMPAAETPPDTPRNWDGTLARKDSLRTPPHSNRSTATEKAAFHRRPGAFAVFVEACVLRNINWTSTNHDCTVHPDKNYKR
jgi:hypothetical protein